MSEYNIFVGNKDVLLLKALAKTIKTTVGSSIELTAIQNLIATSIGYSSWNALKNFNKSDVLFTDISAILKIAIPSTIKLMNISCNNPQDAVQEVYANLYKSQSWSQLWREEKSKTVGLCLVPTIEREYYQLIGFTSELDLIGRLDKLNLFEHVFDPVVKVDTRAIRYRKQSYESCRPILKYLQLYKGVVFIELNSKICNFEFISDSDIDISEEYLHHAITRSAFHSPSSFNYRFVVKDDLFTVLVYKDNEFEEGGSIAGAIRITEENHNQLESYIHSDESYSLVEDTLTSAAIGHRFDFSPILTNSYFDYCRFMLTKLHGCELIANDLKDVVASIK